MVASSVGGSVAPGAVAPPILEVRNLRTYIRSHRGPGKAVDGVSFSLSRGEVLGLVGESGSGKSLTALSVIGLQPRSAMVVGGEVLFDGVDLLQIGRRRLRKYLGSRLALVLQDPMTALDPVMTVGGQLAEPLRIHRRLRGSALRDRMLSLLQLFHIAAGPQRLMSYPHQLSGGMRQRVVGAIAVSADPDVLIADEPTTALDATVQAAYLALLKDIQRRTGFAVLFITHDFGVVSDICDRVAVMYAGRIVETASVERLFTNPAHPYTQALLRSVPDVERATARLSSIPGQPPSIFQMPPGCPFEPRCPVAIAKCRESYPPETVLAPGHTAFCWKLN
jgi:oligopeptide/dipeptide ABC transporter ATP-binding protein